MTSTLTVEQIESIRYDLQQRHWSTESSAAIDTLCDMALSSAGGTRDEATEDAYQAWTEIMRGLAFQRSGGFGSYLEMAKAIVQKYAPSPAPVPEEKSVAVVNDDGEVVVSGSGPVHAAPSAVEEVEAQAFETPLFNSPVPGQMLKVVPKSLALDLARRLKNERRAHDTTFPNPASEVTHVAQINGEFKVCLKEKDPQP